MSKLITAVEHYISFEEYCHVGCEANVVTFQVVLFIINTVRTQNLVY
jgi:hypothetical protein